MLCDMLTPSVEIENYNNSYRSAPMTQSIGYLSVHTSLGKVSRGQSTVILDLWVTAVLQ